MSEQVEFWSCVVSVVCCAGSIIALTWTLISMRVAERYERELEDMQRRLNNKAFKLNDPRDLLAQSPIDIEFELYHKRVTDTYHPSVGPSAR